MIFVFSLDMIIETAIWLRNVSGSGIPYKSCWQIRAPWFHNSRWFLFFLPGKAFSWWGVCCAISSIITSWKSILKILAVLDFTSVLNWEQENCLKNYGFSSFTGTQQSSYRRDFLFSLLLLHQRNSFDSKRKCISIENEYGKRQQRWEKMF